MVYRGSGSVVGIQVARSASRSRQVVVIVDVAVQAGARRIRMGVCQRESDRCVIELSVRP